MDTRWTRVWAGLAGGLLGGLAMNVYARAMNAATWGHEADGASPGWQRVGRGMQPPQALGAAEGDAAVQMGALAYRAATGQTPPVGDRLALGVATHYAFSMGTGAAYVLLADRFPDIRRGRGVLYGLLVWAIADEGLVPALGLSRGPRQLPLGMHAYSMVGHAVYGATLEAVSRIVSSTRGSAAPRG